MGIGWIMGGVALAALAAGGAGAGWSMAEGPLEMWAQGTRQALVGAGLKKVAVPTPVGPQTVFVGGSGPVLLFLHGAGDQAGTWAFVAPALLQRYTVVIPDLAGHGESAPAKGPIEASAIFSALEAVLPSQAGGRKATVVGNSLGAWMAMVLAVRHPDWIEKVVGVNGGALQLPNPTVNLLPKTREEARQTLASTRDAASPAMPDAVLDDLVRLSKEGPLARFAATAPSMQAWVLSEAQLRSLRVPVRLVWGESDQLLPLAYAKRLQTAIPGCRLITIERCGHVPQQEAPVRFLAALEVALGQEGAGK